MFHGHLDYFQNRLLKVGLTQSRETMALRTLTTIDLFYFIMCEDPHEQTSIEIAVDWGSGRIQYDFTLHFRVRDHTTRCWRVCWDGLWTLSFGLSQLHGHGSWLVCEVALSGVGVGRAPDTISHWKCGPQMTYQPHGPSPTPQEWPANVWTEL